MSDTIVEILDQFCDRINQPRESAYVAGTTPAARQYVSLLKFIGNRIFKFNTSGWYNLKRTYTFTVSLGVDLYQLPGDYLQALAGTEYSVTNQIPLAGPLSNASIAFRTYGVVPVGVFTGFQINGPNGYIFNTSPYTQRSRGYFQISPPGQNNTDQNVIAYISKNYFWAKDWVTLTAYVPGNIVTGVANMYICTTGGTSGATRPHVTTGTVVDGTVTWQVYTEPYALAADADFCLFDFELMVEGMRWAWYRSKKQDYAQELADWQTLLSTAVGEQNAGSALVNAGYDTEFSGQWPNVPDGNWSGTGGS